MYVPLNKCGVYRRVRNSISGIEGIKIRYDVLKAFDLSKILEFERKSGLRYLVQIPIMDVRNEITGNEQSKIARASEMLLLMIDMEMHKYFWESGFKESILLNHNKICDETNAIDKAIYFVRQKEYVDIVEFGFSFRYDQNGLPNLKEYGLIVKSKLPLKTLHQRARMP